MKFKNVSIASLLLLAMSLCPSAMATFTNYSTDIVLRAGPHPGVAESGINNYLFQDEQVNLNSTDRDTRILRTDQKVNLNLYPPYLIPLKNISLDNSRELRPVARGICGMEGGFAEILHDKETGQTNVQVCCPPYMIEYIRQTFKVLDKEWLNCTDDGSAVAFYQGKFRDVRSIDGMVSVSAGGDALGGTQFDPKDNTATYNQTPSKAALYAKLMAMMDIPAHMIAVDIKFREIDTQNDLKLGLDYINWKNGPGRDLFDFGLSVAKDHAEQYSNKSSSALPDFRTTDRNRYRGYDAYLSSAYYDFLASKGKSRVLAEAALQTVACRIASWKSVDPVATINATGSQLGGAPLRNVDYVPASLDHDTLVALVLAWAPLGPTPPIWLLGYRATTEYVTTLSNDQLIDALMDSGLEYNFIQSLIATANVPETGGAPIVPTANWNRFVNYNRSVTAGQVGMFINILPSVATVSTEMFVGATVSDLVGLTPQGLPMINESSVTTEVRVRDGETLVLAGLSRSEKVKQKNGIPGLSDIPILGYVFGGETKVDRVKKIVVTLDVATSIGYKDAGTNAPLTAEEVTALKTANKFDQLAGKQLSDKIGDPLASRLLEDLAQAKAQIAGDEKVNVPGNIFGFDQWLLDPEKN